MTISNAELSASMNIALIGYGRMGREIEVAASDRSHNILVKVDPADAHADHTKLPDIGAKTLEVLDGFIEFAEHKGLLDRIAFSSGKPYVIGTTGWNEELPALQQLVDRGEARVLYGSNFSIGANLFFQINKKTAELVSALPNFDIAIAEYHHNKKRDSPSGTAIQLAEDIIELHSRKTTICSEVLQRELRDEELHIASIRCGNIPGIHRVVLSSNADTIVLEHSAQSRKGFAQGAVLGLEWLRTKPSGLYSAEEFFSELFLQS